MKKSEFKSLVKECLLEILKEGIGEIEKDISANEGVKSKKQIVKESVYVEPKKQVVVENQNLKNTTNLVVAGIVDPKMKGIFQGIFEDTAKTTVQEQLERNNFAGTTESFEGAGIIPANPEDIFEGAERWETLAFKPAPSRVGGGGKQVIK